jgi:Ca2+-binding EF-hand superfamily protein
VQNHSYSLKSASKLSILDDLPGRKILAIGYKGGIRVVEVLSADETTPSRLASTGASEPQLPARNVLGDTLDKLCMQLASNSELIRTLLQLDRNKDGKLSRDELRRMPSLRPAEFDGVMEAFDKDGNGYVDYEEFTSVLMKRRATLPVSPLVHAALKRLCDELSSRHQQVYQLLQTLDRNKDGRLSRPELQAGLVRMGVLLPPAELDGVMREFDKDCSGFVDYVEFYTVLMQARHETSSAVVGRLKLTTVFEDEAGQVNGVAFSKTGRMMAAASKDPLRLRIFDTCTWSIMHEENTEDEENAVSFNPSSTKLAVRRSIISPCSRSGVNAVPSCTHRLVETVAWFL